MDLLVDPLNMWLALEQKSGFVGGNMFVYFSPSQVRNQDYRGSDVFVVLDVPFGERKSWVVDPGEIPRLVKPAECNPADSSMKTLLRVKYNTQFSGFVPMQPVSR